MSEVGNTGSIQARLRELFRNIIAAYPDCPKQVVIGKLDWQRLAPIFFDLEKNKHSNVVNHEHTPYYKRKAVDYSRRAFWLTADTETMKLSELVQRIEAVPQESMQLKTIQPESIQPEAIPPEARQRSVHISISKEKIMDFVNDVGDYNPIHRAAPYVVPGCLLLETLLIHVVCDPTIEKVSMKFKEPVYANQMIDLVIDKSQKILTAKVGEHIVFTATVYC